MGDRSPRIIELRVLLVMTGCSSPLYEQSKGTETLPFRAILVSKADG
jgi:hypothetical protein